MIRKTTQFLPLMVSGEPKQKMGMAAKGLPRSRGTARKTVSPSRRDRTPSQPHVSQRRGRKAPLQAEAAAGGSHHPQGHEPSPALRHQAEDPSPPAVAQCAEPQIPAPGGDLQFPRLFFSVVDGILSKQIHDKKPGDRLAPIPGPFPKSQLIT